MSRVSAIDGGRRGDKWLDRFFDSYYRHRPVNATFIGVHDHDRLLPDLSEHGAGDTLADMRGLLRESSRPEPVPAGTPPPDAAHAPGGAHEPAARPPLSDLREIDLRLAKGFLKIQIWEYESDHFHRGNPSLYAGEAVFGVMSLFLSEFAPLAERIESAIERLHAIPKLLAQGRATLEAAPFAWTQRAIRECDGALAFLVDGIPRIVATPPTRVPGARSDEECGRRDRAEVSQVAASRLAAAADVAAVAFAEFREFLDSTLRAAPLEFRGCGPEALARYLSEGHGLDTSADQIVACAEAEMDQAASLLVSGAADLGAAGSDEALATLEELHPDLEHYPDRYQELWDSARETAVANEIVTWPDFPLRYVPRPEWARAAAPHLYFLFYRSPAAFNRPPLHDYLVTPIDASMPLERQRELLRANNDSAIKLNHVIHHGGIGHHVQNWNAFRSGSRIGQVAAVDCASRIAMFCGGTMAEGWACYATDLMAELGALTPLERYALHRDRVRMCARAIVDVRLHSGRITLREAADYYERKAGFSADAARAEAVKNSMFPGAALMYLTGTDGIHRLRAEMESLQGERFSLRGFHDELLSYGSIPVAVISEAMKHTATAGQQDTRNP